MADKKPKQPYPQDRRKEPPTPPSDTPYSRRNMAAIAAELQAILKRGKRK